MSNRERVKGNKAKASGQASETCHEIKTVEEENSHSFACILLASNHINFLVQFGINQHLLISHRLQVALVLWACANG